VTQFVTEREKTRRGGQGNDTRNAKFSETHRMEGLYALRMKNGKTGRDLLKKEGKNKGRHKVGGQRGRGE